MKKTFVLIFLLGSSYAQAFTLNNNVFASFAQDEVMINMASSTDCSATGLTNDEILSLAHEGAALYWNKIATSRLRLRQGELTSVAGSFSTDLICTSGANSNCVPNETLKVSSNILIACNTNPSNFNNSTYVMAVALPNNISGHTIAGALVLINAIAPSSSNVFGNLSRSEQVSVLAHEIGHGAGLGHSAVKDSLMYFQTIESRSAVGWDDIQGMTYLYPKEQPISCSSISSNSNKLPLFSILVFLLFLFVTKPFIKVSLPSHR